MTAPRTSRGSYLSADKHLLQLELKTPEMNKLRSEEVRRGQTIMVTWRFRNWLSSDDIGISIGPAKGTGETRSTRELLKSPLGEVGRSTCFF
jgi:hypothetical protein